MASIQERKNAKGIITSYRVRWREFGRSGPVVHETFKDKAQAETFKRILEINGHDSVKTERDIFRAASVTPALSEVAEQHFARLTDVGTATMNEYRRDLKNHIIPKLGHVPISNIDEDDLLAWVHYMKDKGLAPKTIANVHGLIFSIMKTAIYKKYRADNPCEHTRLPKADHTEDKNTFLTKGEFALILKHTDKHFHPFFLFLIGTGLRFSEATALQPGDFSDNAGVYSVRVTKAWKRDPDKRRIMGPPKTERARRTVGMDKQLAALVAPLIQACEPGDYVFKMKQGGDATGQAMHNKAWQPALKRAKVDGLKKSPRIHDLRHTFASWMLTGDNPMSIFELSRLMGHESVNTTTKVYSHLMPESLVKGAGIMGAAMTGLFNIETAMELEAAGAKALASIEA